MKSLAKAFSKIEGHKERGEYVYMGKSNGKHGMNLSRYILVQQPWKNNLTV